MRSPNVGILLSLIDNNSLQFRDAAICILNRIYNGGHLFQPTDNQTLILADVLPSFSAYFECREDDKAPVKLEVEMQGNATDQALYDKTLALWSRLGRTENTTPLNISMINLVG